MGGGYLADTLRNKANVEDLPNVMAEQVVDPDTLQGFNGLTREQLKKDLFIDMWNEACKGRRSINEIYGRYNPETDLFELNGLTDITFEQAINIYKFGNWEQRESVLLTPTSISAKICPQIRTTLPSIVPNKNVYPSFMWQCDALQVIRYGRPIDTNASYNYFTVNDNIYLANFGSIRAILDWLKPSKSIYIGRDRTATQVLPYFTTLYLYQLAYDVNITTLKALSLESFRFMVDNSNTSSLITVTVHPDVYAKLTDPDNADWYKVFQDAQEKMITFATV